MEDLSVRYGRPRGTAVVIQRSRTAEAELPLHSFHMRKGSEEPTEFGYFLVSKMAKHEPPLSQAELARRTGVGQASISRWIYKPGRPEPEKLRLLADALDVDYDDLLTLAGYGRPSDDVTSALASARLDIDQLASELSAMLEGESPLTDDDRAYIRNTVDRIIDPYRRAMRRRRSA